MESRGKGSPVTTCLLAAVIVGSILGPWSGSADAGGSSAGLEQLGMPTQSNRCAHIHYAPAPPTHFQIATMKFKHGFQLAASPASSSCGQFYGRFKWNVGSSHKCWTAWIGLDKSDETQAGFQLLTPSGHDAVEYNIGPRGASCTAKPNVFAATLSPGQLQFIALPGLKSSKTVFIWISGQSSEIKVDFGHDLLH